MARRRAGLYLTDETVDEAIVSVRQLKANPTEKVLTLRHADGLFVAINLREYMTQIRLWKQHGATILRKNTREIQCGCEGKAHMFILQPSNLDTAMISPLAMAFGMMVNGYAYITLDPALIEIACRTLEA